MGASFFIPLKNYPGHWRNIDFERTETLTFARVAFSGFGPYRQGWGLVSVAFE
jgi:hypothetical protein